MIRTQIELSKLISLLGEYKKEGDEYLFQCPYCIDKSKNNFSFNFKKSFLWCFASGGEHSKQWLKEVYNPSCRDILAKQPQGYPMVFDEEKILSSEQLRKFAQYAYMSNRELLNNQEYLGSLKNKRQINKDTVKGCLIGLDLKKKRFVFPSIEFSMEVPQKVVGFEYRPLDLTKNGLYRSKGTPIGLVQINSFTNKTKTLVIVEGYIDGYTSYQHLKEIGQSEFYHIVTPSNGVGSVMNLLEKIDDNFAIYKEIYAYLDSDEIGIKKMKEIKEKYPNIEIHIMKCGCKDFNEHYQKCLITPRLPQENENITILHHG